MTALVGAIFVASLLGSLHCAGMCGAFLAVAVGGGNNPRRDAALQVTYHAGRLVSYVLIGALAGAMGGLVNVAGALAGVRPLAAVVAGFTMVLFGLTAFLRTRGVTVARLPLPHAWTKFAQRAHGAAMNLPVATRALTIGLLTTLLPCGWLYAFVVTAAGTGSAARGALAMAVFWVGTLPVMVALGTGLQRATGTLGRRLPAVTSAMLVAVGLYTLTTRSLIDPALLAASVQGTAAPAQVPDAAATPECCKEAK